MAASQENNETKSLDEESDEIENIEEMEAWSDDEAAAAAAAIGTLLETRRWTRSEDAILTQAVKKYQVVFKIYYLMTYTGAF